MHEVTVLPLWMFHTAGVLLGQSSTGECPSWGGHSATPSDKIWGEKTALWAFPKPGWAQPVPGLAAPSLAQKTSGLVPSEVFPALVEQQDMGQGFSCSPLTPLLPPLGVGTIAGCKRVLHCLHPTCIHTYMAKSGGRQRGWGPPEQQQRLGSTKTPLPIGSHRAARCFQAPSHLPTLSSHQSLDSLPRSKAEQNKAL